MTEDDHKRKQEDGLSVHCAMNQHEEFQEIMSDIDRKFCSFTPVDSFMTGQWTVKHG
jgi:hypothetical protein